MAEPMTSVQDGPERAYAAFAVVDSLSLASIREANLSFLALIGESSGSPVRLAALGIDEQVAGRVGSLEPAARHVLAACPYALFDVQFGDARLWREIALRPEIAEAALPHAHAAFARVAVFLAWHLAKSNDLAASVVLGMTPEVRRLWRGMPVSLLERAAHAAAPRLSARFGHHPTFWSKLLASAAPDARGRADAVRLLGLQLLAAEGAWPPAGGAGESAR